jgi:hypothetical protein
MFNASDAASGAVLPVELSNMCADKESRELKKKKCMTKQSLARP